MSQVGGGCLLSYTWPAPTEYQPNTNQIPALPGPKGSRSAGCWEPENLVKLDWGKDRDGEVARSGGNWLLYERNILFEYVWMFFFIYDCALMILIGLFYLLVESCLIFTCTYMFCKIVKSTGTKMFVPQHCFPMRSCARHQNWAASVQTVNLARGVVSVVFCVCCFCW